MFTRSSRLLISTTVLACCAGAVRAADCVPEVVGFCPSPGATFVDVVGRYAVIAGGTDATGPFIEVIDVGDPSAPYPLGRTPGTSTGLRCEGSLLFVADGAGLRTMDISNPTAPADIGEIEFTSWEWGIDNIGRMVYLSGFGGLCNFAIVDASSPALPEVLGCVPLPIVWYGYDLAVTEGLAFVADSSFLLVIDHSNPAAPELIGDLPMSYASQVELSRGLVYVIEEFTGTPLGGSLTVVDPSDPVNPRVVASLSVRSGILSVSDNYACVMNMGGTNLELFDISDPLVPVPIGTYHRDLAHVMNAVIREPYAYIAGGDGLTILDLSSCPGTAPCNDADFAEPFGVLDMLDVGAFVDAFIAWEPSADLDGNGIRDLRDVNLFVNEFVAGCP